MRWLLIALAVFTSAGSAHADPVRILLAVGARHGAPGEPALRYSVDDARRVRDVLVALGGVRAENALLVVDPTPTKLRHAFARARSLTAGHGKDEVTFFFYFSGHGDRERLHLGEQAISIAELTSAIEAVPAALRVAVTDACRTASLRPKGVSAEPAFPVSIAPLVTASGTAWIHATADGEAAQESDVLGGAVFTHYFVSALRGAADGDGDGRVTLGEAYQFAYHLTLMRSARSSGALQRPTAELTLQQRAPVVLTETARRSARLRLPRERDVQYLVYAIGTRAVVAEIWGRHDRSAELALAPGRYLVHRRARARSALAEVTFRGNQQRDLVVDDFKPVSDEAMAKKGGQVVLRPSALGIAYGLRAGTLVGVGHGGRLLYTYRLNGWAVGGGVEAGVSGESAGRNDVRFAWAGGELRIERRLDLDALELRVGARAVGLYGFQTLERTDSERVASFGYPTQQDFSGAAIGAGALVRALVPIGDFYGELGGTGDVLGARRGTEPKAFFTVAAEAGFGWTF